MVMNEKLFGVIRHVLTAVGGYFVAKGIVDEATVTQLVGAVTSIVGFVWSWMAKRKQD